MFYYEIPWFYEDFKKENLCFLNLYAVHPAKNTEPVTRSHVNSSQMRNEASL